MTGQTEAGLLLINLTKAWVHIYIRHKEILQGGVEGLLVYQAKNVWPTVQEIF